MCPRADTRGASVRSMGGGIGEKRMARDEPGDGSMTAPGIDRVKCGYPIECFSAKGDCHAKENNDNCGHSRSALYRRI